MIDLPFAPASCRLLCTAPSSNLTGSPFCSSAPGASSESTACAETALSEDSPSLSPTPSSAFSGGSTLSHSFNLLSLFIFRCSPWSAVPLAQVHSSHLRKNLLISASQATPSSSSGRRYTYAQPTPSRFSRGAKVALIFLALAALIVAIVPATVVTTRNKEAGKALEVEEAYTTVIDGKLTTIVGTKTLGLSTMVR